VRDKFRKPLRIAASENGGLRDPPAPDTLDRIFFRLDDLIALHSEIAKDIKPKKADVGLVFSKKMHRIREVYSGYCLNLPRAVALVEELSAADPAGLGQLLASCQAKATPPTFPLSSHLVIPFQRFLKYHLILKEILKHTDEDLYGGSLFVNLNKAVDEMLSAGVAVNERKREEEELDRADESDTQDMALIRKVQETIKMMRLPGSGLLTDYGRLRKMGEADVWQGGGPGAHSAQLHADWVFLFDKLIILAYKPKWLQHRYRFREAIKTKDIFLEAPRRDANHNPTSTVIRCFSKVNPRQILFSMAAKSKRDAEAWFAALVTALDAINPQQNQAQGHVIELTTFAGDQHRVKCHHCQKTLPGKFFQGYRCLRCQAVLHKDCLASFSCLEVGTTNITGSVHGSTLGSRSDSSLGLPVRIAGSEDETPSEERGSTLSLAGSDFGAGSGGGSKRASAVINHYQSGLAKEWAERPLLEQSWFAGDLSTRVGTARLETLPLGTFLVRQRANNSLALMVKTTEGVKQMKIEETWHNKGTVQAPLYYLSEARMFNSVQELILHYRTEDLTENFNYEFLRGLKLKIPFKDV